MFSRPNSRDPIKQAPLHDPAESLKSHLDDLLWDGFAPWMFTSMFAVILAALEWYQWAFSLPPSPKLMTVFAVGCLAYAAWRFTQLRPELHRLRLGIRGERAVGQFLQQEIVPLGYRIFHDVREDGFNIDHVAIGPGGVFAIETKTHSKPAGDARVVFDGTRVTIGGRQPDRDPIAQSLASAAAVRRILKQFSGVDEKPRPVVLYPGWWVDEARAEVWVLNETRFAGYLRHETPRLNERQIAVLSEALARYVRERIRIDEAK
jgi:hypothetical protein